MRILAQHLQEEGRILREKPAPSTCPSRLRSPPKAKVFQKTNGSAFPQDPRSALQSRPKSNSERPKTSRGTLPSWSAILVVQSVHHSPPLRSPLPISFLAFLLQVESLQSPRGAVQIYALSRPNSQERRPAGTRETGATERTERAALTATSPPWKSQLPGGSAISMCRVSCIQSSAVILRLTATVPRAGSLPKGVKSPYGFS
eukprot:scaffold34_cov260-Pinguiococcus_pyrenoidosus.AAC.44